MAAPDLTHVTPGETIPQPSAALINAYKDAAADLHARNTSTSQSTQPAIRTHDVIAIKNMAAAVPRFGILAVSGISSVTDSTSNPDGFKTRPLFNGSNPAVGSQFAITLEPIANGSIGRAVISGIVQVTIAMVHEDHKRATFLADDLEKLQSSQYGAAEILWTATSSTGEQWAVVRLGGEGRFMRIELVDDLEPGATVTASPLDDDDVVDRDYSVEVTDTLGDKRGRAWVSSVKRGSQGLAYQPPDTTRWELVTLQPHALRISGETSAVVYYDDTQFTATATPVIMNPTGAIALHDYTTAYLIKNPLGLQFASGDKFHAEWNEKATTPQWEAVDVGRPRPHRITGEASGTVTTSTTTFSLKSSPAPVIINPVDAISEEDYTAANLIKNPYELSFATGDTVFIEWNKTVEQWEAVGPSSTDPLFQARWLQFQASVAFLTGGTITIDTRTYYDGEDPAVAITSILNPLDLTGYNDCIGIAIINTDVSPPTYTAISVKPVAEEVLTDFNVDTSTNKFQKKTRDISIMPRGDEDAAWVDIHTGDDCA